jgi:DNA-binding PadR family transcriptional regulator
MLRSARFLAVSALVLSACRPDAPRADVRDYGEVRVATIDPLMMPNGKRSPIEAARVWADVEQQETFLQQRGAACLKEIDDRIEELRRYPTCELLEGLKYATLTNTTMRGRYVKAVALTDEGRSALAADLDDRGDRLVFAVAKRELARGYVRFESAPGREDRIVVTFNWRWKPVNALGKGLDLRDIYSGRDEHQGRATYDRTEAGWALVELWLDKATKNYMSGV